MAMKLLRNKRLLEIVLFISSCFKVNSTLLVTLALPNQKCARNAIPFSRYDSCSIFKLKCIILVFVGINKRRPDGPLYRLVTETYLTFLPETFALKSTVAILYNLRLLNLCTFLSPV